MTDLVIVRIQQARVQARAGNYAKAVELLEQARALARDDREVLVPILRELAEVQRMAGRVEQASRTLEELTALAPGDAKGAGSEVVLQPITGRSRTKVALVGLGGGLAAAVGVIIWLLAGRYYGERPVIPTPPEMISTSGTASVGSAPMPPAGTGASNSSPGAAMPAASASPVTSGQQNAAGPNTGSSSAAGGIVIQGSPSQMQPPAGSMPAASPPAHLGVSTAGPGAQARLLKENVGMLLRVARYQGVMNGRLCRLEVPVKGGTCFAISQTGIMLSNKHVTTVATDDIPRDASDFGAPLLTLRGMDLVVCLGADDSEHYQAELLHESSRYDLAILRINRKFDRPLVLSIHSPVLGQPILACGYPGPVADFLNMMNGDEMRDRIRSEARMGTVSYASWFTPDAFEPTLTAGIVSSTSRRMDGAAYIQIDAKVSHGNSGGPLLSQANEVLGIMTLSLGDTGHEAYNFALSTLQIRSEIDPYLRTP